MKKRGLSILVSVVLVIVIAMSFIGCASTTTTPTTTTPTTTTPTTTTPTTTTTPAQTEPTEIKVGASVPLSGWAVTSADRPCQDNYQMWVDEVNAQGGIFIKDFNKKIPLKLILYDDTSDPSKCVQNYEKLILQDKVDFLLAPWGTAFHFAVAPLVNQYKYPLIGVTETSNDLRDQAKYSLPYFFGLENQALEVATGLVNVLKEEGVKTTAVTYVGTLYGIDFTSILLPLLEQNGIENLYYKSYPVDVKDVSVFLKEIADKNPDAYLSFSYPEDGFLIQEGLISLGWSPKAFYNSFAGFPDYMDKFGADTVEGVMGSSAQPYDTNPDAKDYYDRFLARWGVKATYECAYSWASMQIWEDVLANVSLYDREAQKDYIANNAFDTIWGHIKFVDQYNIITADNPDANPGVLSQIQDGIFKVLEPKEKRDAQGITVIYPKPAW